MINITLPDGAVRQYEKGTNALQVAQSISEGLARNVLGAKVNGEVWDATRPIETDSSRIFLPGTIHKEKKPCGILLRI